MTPGEVMLWALAFLVCVVVLVVAFAMVAQQVHEGRKRKQVLYEDHLDREARRSTLPRIGGPDA